MAATQTLTPSQQAQVVASIQADPKVQAILSNPSYTPENKNEMVNDYLANSPSSPTHEIMGYGSGYTTGGDGIDGAFNYDPTTGKLNYTDTDGHPLVMKIAAGGVLAAMTLGAAAPAVFAAGTGAAVGSTGAAAGVAGTEAAIDAAAGTGAAAAGAAGAGGAASTLGSTASILGSAGKIASAISPVLGGAATAAAKANATEQQLQVSRDQLNQTAALDNNKLPAQNLAAGVRASLANAGPTTFSGLPAPGFGKTGGAPAFSGGAQAPLDPQVKALAQSVMSQELNNQLTGSNKIPGATPNPGSSIGEDLLTAGSLGSSILGAAGKIAGGPSGPAAAPSILGQANDLSGPPQLSDADWANLLGNNPNLDNYGNIVNPSLLGASF